MQQQAGAQADTDVVVVGAGPVGLLLGTELALAGVRVRILERATAPAETIKAGSINIASAEILARRGLHEEARRAHDRSVRRVAALMAAPGMDPTEVLERARRRVVRAGHFAAIPLDNEKLDTTDPDIAAHNELVDATLVVQRDVEAILGGHADRLGLVVCRGVEVTGVTASADGVRVETSAGPLRAGYLVGCDGGRSAVRRAAAFAFPGSDPEITGRQAQLDIEDASKLEFGWNWSQRGVYRFGPTPGLLLTVEFDGPPADRTREVTAEEMRQSLLRVSGIDVTVGRLHGESWRWTDNARQAETYRKGRVLLAGDAAHVHSPFSGQGLNLGLGDATNLGWKLAAVVKGWASEGLLDTYDAERHPVGAWVLDWTRAQVALMRPDRKVAQLRGIVADLMSTPDGMTRIVNEISGVLQRVDLPGSHPLVGRLVPDTTLADGRSIRELFRDGRFVLLDRTAEGLFLAAASPWRERLAGRHEATPPDREPSALLVRPDGVVAWAAAAGEAGDRDGLRDALHRWAGAPAGASGPED